jgi:hypothetical protein
MIDKKKLVRDIRFDHWLEEKSELFHSLTQTDGRKKSLKYFPLAHCFHVDPSRYSGDYGYFIWRRFSLCSSPILDSSRSEYCIGNNKTRAF